VPEAIEPADSARYVVAVDGGDVMVFQDETEATYFVAEQGHRSSDIWYARADGTSLSPERITDAPGWRLRGVPGVDRSSDLRDVLLRSIGAMRRPHPPAVDPSTLSTPQLVALHAVMQARGCALGCLGVLAALLVGYAYRRSQ
jgi:hypothetical protein